MHLTGALHFFRTKSLWHRCNALLKCIAPNFKQGELAVQDPTLSLILRSWAWQPAILLGLGLVAAGYGYAFHYFRQHGRLERWFQQGLLKRSQPWYFAAGLITLGLALLSPIDTLSNTLFVMHMTQHILLVMVAAPLIILGLPAPFLTPLITNDRLKQALAWLVNPFVAFALYNITLALWHLPKLYEAALHNEALHDLEHAMFFYTAVLSWWPLLSPLSELPRLSYPAQMLYIFLMAIPASILSALLVFSEGVLYPTYAVVPQLWGLPALADQQAGGLVMMIPGKAIYLVALTIVFFTWFNQEEPVGREQLL
jgi:cytochrome c oxidase assembly factor CtaG